MKHERESGWEIGGADPVSVPEILLSGIAATQARARAVRIAAWAQAGTELPAIAEEIGGVLREALGAAHLALASYDDERLSLPANEADVAAPTRPRPAAEEERAFQVAGVAFVARMVLRQHQQRLRAEGSTPQLLDACEGSLRAALKSLRALARAIREVEGLPRGPESDADVESSRRVRRAYAAFHGDVLREHPISPAGARIRLRCTLAAIARLFGAVGPLMRFADRRLLEELRDRIIACLDGDPTDADDAVAQLYSDLESTAGLMLHGVNRREELLEHDRRALLRATVALALGEDSELLRATRAVAGRDPTLDALVRLGDTGDRETWEQAVLRARARIERDAPTADRGGHALGQIQAG